MKISTRAIYETVLLTIIMVLGGIYFNVPTEMGIFLFGTGLGIMWGFYWENRLSKGEKTK